MDFTCPACDVLLSAQTPDGLRLWKCPLCGGFAISLPSVRKGLNAEAFKKIWQKISSGETTPGRPCPGCRKPLLVVEADGKDGAIPIDVCRTCQVLWFDDREFPGLPRSAAAATPRAVPEPGQVRKPVSRLLTPEELTYAAFEEEQYRRRSFLLKLLDGSVAKELGLDEYFGELFDD